MPLTKSESKQLLDSVFRLTLAIQQNNTHAAAKEFREIVEIAVGEDEPVYSSAQSCCRRECQGPMGCEGAPGAAGAAGRPSIFEPIHVNLSAIPKANENDDEVKLVIMETDQPAELTIHMKKEEKPDVSVEEEASEDAAVEADNEEEEEEELVEGEVVEENEEVVEEEEEVVEEEEEEVVEEEEEEVVEEEEELDLEPVRIRKVIYWKDKNSGKLFTYINDEECGDQVGQYVNGVPVFEPR